MLKKNNKSTAVKKTLSFVLAVSFLATNIQLAEARTTKIKLSDPPVTDTSLVVPSEQIYLENILLGKIPTSNVGIENSSIATNGEQTEDFNRTLRINAGEETGGVDNGFSNWKQVYVQYDFGIVQPVKEIDIYRLIYPNAISTFKDVKVELSKTADFTPETTIVVYDTADIEETVESKGTPQIIAFDNPIEAQYIRIYQRGHYIQNHSANGNIEGWNGYSNGTSFNEIEVKIETNSPPEELPVKNLALLKYPYSSGKSLINPQNLNDGNLNTFAVQESIGLQSVQYNYRNAYNISEIKFKLEAGITYPRVRIEVSSDPTSGFTTIYDQRNYRQNDNMTTITLDTPIKKKNIRFSFDGGQEKVKISELEVYGSGLSFDESPVSYDGTRDNTLYNNLVWNDEFNGDTVDETKWTIVDGMINHAAIYSKDAVSIKKNGDESYLALNSKNYGTYDNLTKSVKPDIYLGESPNKNLVTWRSGRIESKDKYSVEYGRIVVRAKVNGTKGIWPAIWALSQDEKGHDEIDILEYPQYDSNQAYEAWTTNWFGKWKYNAASHGQANKGYEAWCENFHVFETEWDKDSMRFFLDGVKVFETTAGRDDGRDSMHRRPMFTILETQVGSGWSGNVSENLTDKDTDFLVDWVRIYQKPGDSKVFFDDLDRSVLTDAQPVSNDYLVSPIKTSGQDSFTYLKDGKEAFEDKNAFFYGGQPRYEKSRLAQKEGVTGQYLIYNIPNLKDIHLSTYYQTLSDKTGKSPTNETVGISIRDELMNKGGLDFELYTSPSGEEETWQKVNNLQIFDNTVDAHPGYARHTYDAYDLPAGTNYIKIVFPDTIGKTYKMGNGNIVPVKTTDVQLAKVILVQY